MPTYSYRCPHCGHEYEAFQKISDEMMATCPECGERGERLITGGAGLVFKGSGFYVTDYKRAGDAKGDTKPKTDDKKTDDKKKKRDSSPPSSSSSDKGKEGDS